MKPACILLFAAALALFAPERGAAADLRFSTLLSAEERQTGGLTKLTSDQVAVIDALVRRDTAARGNALNSSASSSSATEDKSKPPPAAFSQRLTEGERGTAGLPTLSAAEVAQLDAFVERQQNAKFARTLLAPPVFLAKSRLDPTELKKERQIHGSFSLSFGWGSGGYSERTGSMMLNFEDPAKGYAISVGYSESHIKGGHGVYRDPYHGDPFYRDPFERDLLYRDSVYEPQRDLSLGVPRP